MSFRSLFLKWICISCLTFACSDMREIKLSEVCRDDFESSPIKVESSMKVAGLWHLNVAPIHPYSCINSDVNDDMTHLDRLDIGPLSLETEGGKILYSLGDLERNSAGAWRVGEEFVLDLDLGQGDPSSSQALSTSPLNAVSRIILFVKEVDRDSREIYGVAELRDFEDISYYRGEFILTPLSP